MNRADDGAAWHDFEHSLFVYTTVMSHTTDDYAVVDAGLKGIGIDGGMPLVFDWDDARYEGASDEHGKLVFGVPSSHRRLGAKIRLVPFNCDPTVNLYDYFVCYRGDCVEAIWPITARGAVL